MNKYERQVRRLFNIYQHPQAEEIIQWLLSIHQDTLTEEEVVYDEDYYIGLADRLGW